MMKIYKIEEYQVMLLLYFWDEFSASWLCP